MDVVEIIRLSLLVTHFVGLAAIIGAFILQMPRRDGFDFSPVLVGSIVQLVTGNALIAASEIAGDGVDRAKVIVKLAITLFVFVLGLVGVVRSRRLRRRDASNATLRSLLWAAGIAAIANVIVAVVWR